MPNSRASQPATGLRNRIRYRFDLLLAKGLWAVLLWLGVITIAAVLVSSLLLTIAGVSFSGSDDSSWPEDFWQSMLRAIDPGTMAADVGWGRRVLALVITIVGLLIAGTLIGLIAAVVEQRVERMQRGRSAVVETGHVAILGASDRLPIIIDQLVLANPGRKTDTIVVLADREPVEMSEEVRSVVRDTKGRRLVYRSGDSTRPQDLELASVDKARAVIVLANEGPGGDAAVVKTVLATGALLGGFDRVPIVAELVELEAAETLVRACGGNVHPVVALQTVARASVLALREPGLKDVIEELLDYRGSDISLIRDDVFVGRTFGDVLTVFSNARPIGRLRQSGEVEINPDADTILEREDRLVVVAEDREHLTPATDEFSGLTASRRPPPPLAPAKKVEHLLLIGWNGLGRQLIAQWRPFAAPGSSIEVVYDSQLFESDDLDLGDTYELDVRLTPTRRSTWQPEDAAHASRFTAIAVLGYRHKTSASDADSRTLLNLLLLRREFAAWDVPTPRLIAELRDVDNLSIASMTGADDYLVSDSISSRTMAQLAEQPRRRAVFQALYASDGPSVHLVGVDEFDLGGRDVRWAEVIVTASAAGVLAIGLRRVPSGDVVLNPPAGDHFRLDSSDQLVVIG